MVPTGYEVACHDTLYHGRAVLIQWLNLIAGAPHRTAAGAICRGSHLNYLTHHCSSKTTVFNNCDPSAKLWLAETLSKVHLPLGDWFGNRLGTMNLAEK